jgi:hypothetical protein
MTLRSPLLCTLPGLLLSGGAESMGGKPPGLYSASFPFLEAAYPVGSRVVYALVADWARFADHLPEAPAP